MLGSVPSFLVTSFDSLNRTAGDGAKRDKSDWRRGEVYRPEGLAVGPRRGQSELRTLLAGVHLHHDLAHDHAVEALVAHVAAHLGHAVALGVGAAHSRGVRRAAVRTARR